MGIQRSTLTEKPEKVRSNSETNKKIRQTAFSKTFLDSEQVC